MKSLVSTALAALVFGANACPVPARLAKRQQLSEMNDFDILNYALTLEHLEDTFYRQGLAKFTLNDFTRAGFDAAFYNNVKSIAEHEASHVAFLTGAIEAAGGNPVLECTYAFGITTVAGFVATASVLEGVGQSAYLGAARQIANKNYLTAAGSILTVEARHSSYLRVSLSQTPFAQSLDNPLTPNMVHTMASGFITSCPPNNPTFPIKAFPNLAVATTGSITSGQLISIKTTNTVLVAHDSGAHLHAAFITAGGPVYAQMTEAGDGINFQVTVPAGVLGQSYLLFNDCNTTLSDSTVVAGPVLMEISGPSPGGLAVSKE
ncbi:hypothetical protein LTR95_007703 [Oleoguttula sp. CCFEE 5521]